MNGDQSLSSVDDEVEVFFRTPPTVKCTALEYWCTAGERDFPKLAKLSLAVLCIPASSAPIERVFSHGGIMMRPHRASMSASLLQELVFLKCNRM